MTRWKITAGAIIAVAVVAAASLGWWWKSSILLEGILEGYGCIEATEVTVSSKVSGRNEAAGERIFERVSYYFCSAGCLAKFDQAPQRFAAGRPSTSAGKAEEPKSKE